VTKEASKLFLPLKKTLLGEFSIGISNLNKPGESKGVGLYEIDNEMVVLMGSIPDEIVGFYSTEIVKHFVVEERIILDLKMTIPDNNESYKIFTTSTQNDGFDLVYGVAAGLLNEMKARGMVAKLLLVPRNDKAFVSFRTGMEELGLKFSFKENDLRKELLKLNGFSSMFI
jgi:hypothetical protein